MKIFKKLKWVLIAILVLSVLQVLSSLFGLFRFNIEVQVEYLVFGLGFLLLTYAFYKWTEHFLKPKAICHVSTQLKITAPRLSINRYVFDLKIKFVLEQKGQTLITHKERELLKLKKEDHPDIIGFFLSRSETKINDYVENFRDRNEQYRINMLINNKYKKQALEYKQE